MSRSCAPRKRRTFSRLPHIFMSHQRRARFFVVSRNSHAQVAAAQVRTRSISGETMRSTADRTTGVSGAARSSSSRIGREREAAL